MIIGETNHDSARQVSLIFQINLIPKELMSVLKNSTPTGWPGAVRSMTGNLPVTSWWPNARPVTGIPPLVIHRPSTVYCIIWPPCVSSLCNVNLVDLIETFGGIGYVNGLFGMWRSKKQVIGCYFLNAISNIVWIKYTIKSKFVKTIKYNQWAKLPS